MEIGIVRMRHLNQTTIPVVIRVLGIVKKNTNMYIKEIPETPSLSEIYMGLISIAHLPRTPIPTKNNFNGFYQTANGENLSENMKQMEKSNATF